MNGKISIVSGRVHIPAATQAGAPVVLTLEPGLPCIKEINVSFSDPVVQVVNITTTGWRVRDSKGLIIPDNGSNYAGFTPAAQEGNWSPFRLGDPVTLHMYNRRIEGVPYRLIFEFFSTGAITPQASVYVTTCEDEYTVNDLVLEMARDREQLKRMMENYARTNHDTAKHLTG